MIEKVNILIIDKQGNYTYKSVNKEDLYNKDMTIKHIDKSIKNYDEIHNVNIYVTNDTIYKLSIYGKIQGRKDMKNIYMPQELNIEYDVFGKIGFVVKQQVDTKENTYNIVDLHETLFTQLMEKLDSKSKPEEEVKPKEQTRKRKVKETKIEEQEEENAKKELDTIIKPKRGRKAKNPTTEASNNANPDGSSTTTTTKKPRKTRKTKNTQEINHESIDDGYISQELEEEPYIEE